MPDGNTTPEGQEPSTPSGEGSGRSIDSFPAEAQDYIRRLRAEAAEHRNKSKDALARLEEYDNQNKSEQQKLAERAAAAEKIAADSASQLLRYKVAADKGLPLNFADRLRGTTEEELAKDADKLKEDFGLADSAPTGRSGFDGGVRRPVSQPKTMNELIRNRVLGH